MKRLQVSSAVSLISFLMMLGVIGCARRDLDPNNVLPIGFLESPANGASVPAQMEVIGWAMDDTGISDIRIFIDGRIAAHAKIEESRADVARTYPAYAKGTDIHGWKVTVPFDYHDGAPHQVMAQAVDTQGATRDLGTAYVTLAH